MSCVSRRVSVRFILGCGSSSANASVSGLRLNFLAMTSNGGASATCLRWSGSMAWHGTQRACARRLPLSASAASAAGASRIAGSSRENRSDCIIPAPAFWPPVRIVRIPYRVLPRSAHRGLGVRSFAFCPLELNTRGSQTAIQITVPCQWPPIIQEDLDWLPICHPAEDDQALSHDAAEIPDA